MDYAHYFDAFSREHPDLAAELAGSRGLSGVMSWMKRHGLALADVDILNQDEFDLDFMIPLRDGRHIVFGIT
jgi:hypothetical protein